MSDLFEMVGVKPELAEQQVPEKENRWYDTIPWLSVIILILIVGGCLFCNRIMTKDPSYMDLKNYTIACKEQKITAGVCGDASDAAVSGIVLYV